MMGGRGGRGGAKKNGGGLKIPMLSGSEKQVSWANDILKTPYDMLGKNAEAKEKEAAAFDKASSSGHGGDRERSEAAAMRAAQTRYAKEVSSLPSMAASAIIDKRNALKEVANNILKDEYKKRNLSALNAPKL